MHVFSGKIAAGLLALAVCFGVADGMLMAAEQPNYLMVSVADNAKGDAKTLQAKVLIDAPPNAVWETVTNYRQLKNVLPGYEKSTVLKDGGRTKLLDIAMKVSAFLPTYKYQVQVHEMAAERQIQLRRVSGDFKSLQASYKMIPQADGRKTLLVYDLSIDPGIRIPGSQAILKANTEKSLRALESHVEQEYRKRVIGQR